ncbi:serine hydrolase domain-containing protein [Sphingomonas sp. DT-207]|uniref:serine hydrolase domain-containing protein n=1 Tax=Sphingomonas sp. DT-207 TaxID=3396167 RepID=UPI003F198DA1
MIRTAVLALLCATAAPALAQTQAPPAAVESSELQAALSAQPHPVAIFVLGDGPGRGAAAGLADPTTGRRLTIDTPMRIASNTKTFVAATVLRLWEDGRIGLDAPIGPLLDPKLDALLRKDGYDTSKITVRHLLSHSAGLYDHGSDDRFVEAMRNDPKRRYTRESLIGLLVEWADPQTQPGTEFRYSDDGYILLGDIVERIAGKPLAAAVREQLGLDRLGLRSTYWEVYEQPRPGAPERARQFLGETDVTHVDPSLDLFGGGGLVMSPRDLATFMKALFEGRVFKRRRTIEVMLTEGQHKDADKYRFGIFVRHTPAGDIYWHSGFWGTWAGYSPTTGIAVAGMATRQGGFKAMMPIVDDLLAPKK